MAQGTSREHLIETARACLDEHGLEGLTLREVARRAGVSHGAPLRHFDSLAALCSAVTIEAFRGLYDEVAAAMDATGEDPGERLRAAGAAYVRFAVGHPGPYSLMFRPDRCDPTDVELQEAGQAAFAQLLFAVSEAQGAGWHPDQHTADLAGVVWATVHGLANLTIQSSLPAVVALNGGNADLDHLVTLAQDLLSGDVSVHHALRRRHMTVTDNPYLAGNFGPVTEEVTAFDLEVTGTIPDGLDGRLLRNGPNPRGEVDPAMHHWFVGDGMVHGVRLRDGRAEWYRNRWVGGDGPIGPNTNVIGHTGKTLALVEHGILPVELTDELETVGTNGFEGTLSEGYTAHPKRHPGTGELHAVSYFFAWDHVRYTIVGTDGRVRREVQVPVPGHPMVHDCAITEDHLLLFDLPCTFDLDAAMAGHLLPYRWHPEEGARVGVLPHEGDAEDVTWYEVEPCYVYHPLNSWAEDDGRFVVDVVRHPKMFADDPLGPNEGATRLDRWTIDTVAGKVNEETLDDRSVELPRHDERRLGRPYRYGYAMEVGGAFEHGGAVKYDLHTGTTERHDFGEGHLTLEPVFVPRSEDAAEDEGWILSYVYDAATDRSDVVILAADDFAGDPVATVHLPQRVPFGFHGNWVPDSGH